MIHRCFAILLLLFSAFEVRAEDSRPNLVFLLTDDQSPYMMGYDNPEIKTPVMDELASRGVIFDRFYCNTAICMGSRAVIMSGMYEFKNGCNFNHGPMTKETFAASYPALLQKNGYHTGFIGKLGFAVKEEGGNSSYHHQEDLAGAAEHFDFWAGWPGQGKVVTAEAEAPKVKAHAEEYPHVTRAVGATARDFIQEAVKTDKPFSLSVSFKVPHGPYSADPLFDDLYPEDYQFPRRPNFGVKEGIPIQASSGRQTRIGESWINSYDKYMGAQARMMHGVDHAVGMILEELEAQGVANNTVILFCTDNGYLQGAHGLGGKVLPYEEGARSPAWMVDLREEIPSAGKRIQRPCSTIDVAATLLDLADVSAPERMDGKSLRPFLKDPQAEVHSDVLLTQCWGPSEGKKTYALTVVSENWKYIRWAYEDSELDAAEELYQLGDDSYELKNEASNPERQSVLSDMRARYDGYVEFIKEEGMDENSYQPFKVIFDRNAPAEERRSILSESKIRTRK